MAKKKKSKIKLALVIFLVVLIGVTAKSSLRADFKDPLCNLFEPVQQKFKSVDSFLISLKEVVVNLNQWQRRITQLEKEKMRLMAKNVKLQQVEKENETLRKALEMELEQSFGLIFTKVIGKRIEQGHFILNKGSGDGVKKGMPVINSNKNVVGKIIQVGRSNSRVRLISHPDSVFSAQIQEQDVKAEIKGEGGYRVKLDFIPADKKVEKDQIVITSSLGKDYPEGLLVGKIKNVEQKDVKPFQVANVKPYFEKNNDHLFIINNY